MRTLLLLLGLLSLTIPWQPTFAQENSLSNHPSPYLAMHGNDPVLWHTWGEEAFEAARRDKKLLFVSSGYFSCHWCHVMQKESYQNEEIASLINRHFIPVKVDRELNPALDAYLIKFLENTQGYSGWPLNVFITPQGHPLVGLVYLPPDDFKHLLQKINTLWATESEMLIKDAADGAHELALLQTQPSSHIATPHDLNNYYKSLLSQSRSLADEFQGGFGEQSKFPMVPQMQALLELYRLQKDPALGNFLQQTLNQMARLGLHDHIGGGFYRYVVDPNWHVPHFEKMLYDNALLVQLYFQAADVFTEPYYKEVALDTVDFMLRDMQHIQGGFIASLSAVDDKNREGAYYLWQDQQIQSLLNRQEYRLISKYWKLVSDEKLEHGQHIVQQMSLENATRRSGTTESQAIPLYNSARSKLLSARKKRSLPKDNKRLASWNALALSALTTSLGEVSNAKYRKAAIRTHRYLTTQLWDGEQLHRARQEERSLGRAGVEDYALVARALLDWYKVSDAKEDLELARTLTKQAWTRFYKQGWIRSEEKFLEYGNKEYLLTDDVLPSASAVIIENSLRLSRLLGDKALEKQARQALALSHTSLNNEPFWYVGYISIVRKLANN